MQRNKVMERPHEADLTTIGSSVLSTGTKDLCAFSTLQSKTLVIGQRRSGFAGW